MTVFPVPLSPSNRTGLCICTKFFNKCDISCETCSDEPDKCNTCAMDYFFVDNLSSRKCLNQKGKKENSIYSHYYLDNSDPTNLIFKECDISCKTCEDGNNNKACIQCNDNSISVYNKFKIVDCKCFEGYYLP